VQRLSKPFVFINSAMSADGKISSAERRQVRISGPEDLVRVDELRASSDAIMIGVGTVLSDNPSLRVKSDRLRKERLMLGRPENPLRVVADSLARTSPEAKILGHGCLVAVSNSAPLGRLEKLSLRCDIIKCGERRVDLSKLMSELYQKGVKRLMVEGGAELNWSLVQSGLVDEIYVYIGPLLIGGKDAPTLMDGLGFREDFPRLKLISAQKIEDGALLRWSTS
jgi:2,5-diamino-6-(ribosylamino)-4(3H)-pyrimidinone 5'-phosphate reductase